MAYKIIHHEERNGSRILSILVNPEEEDTRKLIVETFDWGLDIPWATVQRETKALLDAKYAPGKPLKGVGKNL